MKMTLTELYNKYVENKLDTYRVFFYDFNKPTNKFHVDVYGNSILNAKKQALSKALKKNKGATFLKIQKITNKESLDLVQPDINTGYFNFNNDGVEEFIFSIKKFMKKFGIGTKINPKYWGDKKTNNLQKSLYGNLKKDSKGNISLKQSKFDLYNDFRKDVKSKSYTKSDFARVARTESANIKAVTQLLEAQKLGAIKVIHKNNARSVARKTVSTKCKSFNNRKFEIKYLLSKRGEKDRICIHPNCMCRYEIDSSSIKQDRDLNKGDEDILRQIGFYD